MCIKRLLAVLLIMTLFNSCLRRNDPFNPITDGPNPDPVPKGGIINISISLLGNPVSNESIKINTPSGSPEDNIVISTSADGKAKYDGTVDGTYKVTLISKNLSKSVSVSGGNPVQVAISGDGKSASASERGSFGTYYAYPVSNNIIDVSYTDISEFTVPMTISVTGLTGSWSAGISSSSISNGQTSTITINNPYWDSGTIQGKVIGTVNGIQLLSHDFTIIKDYDISVAWQYDYPSGLSHCIIHFEHNQGACLIYGKVVLQGRNIPHDNWTITLNNGICPNSLNSYHDMVAGGYLRLIRPPDSALVTSFTYPIGTFISNGVSLGYSYNEVVTGDFSVTAPPPSVIHLGGLASNGTISVTVTNHGITWPVNEGVIVYEPFQ